ncbi:EamA family transporter [Streptomyces sp. NRRL B-24484]|uniref:EamA family transporter n=1 Tax=Streptomyces sp. NRRL B-24484 TaxID=1463833 RepID=UPI0004C119A3|nr:EamA family transporter [Streptomyces sp. NRRL B-24484]
MEGNLRWIPVTAVAPVAWGVNYFVTQRFLPPDHPLFGAAVRALPAGLLLLALCRELPRGVWWGRSAVLGLLNTSAFFVLVYAASQLLATSVASTVMALAPLAMMLAGWALLGERPRPAHLVGAGVGLGGVCLMLLGGAGGVSPAGVLASSAAMLVSSLGFVLGKRWGAGAGVLASTAWQLVAGGLFLLPVTAAVEGPPPALGASALLAFGYTSVVATALAFAAWFAGLRHLPAGTVGLIGLLNPLTGVLLGTLLAGESLTLRQSAGAALILAGIVLGRPAGAGQRPAVSPPRSRTRPPASPAGCSRASSPPAPDPTPPAGR